MVHASAQNIVIDALHGPLITRLTKIAILIAVAVLAGSGSANTLCSIEALILVQPAPWLHAPFGPRVTVQLAVALAPTPPALLAPALLALGRQEFSTPLRPRGHWRQAPAVMPRSRSRGGWGGGKKGHDNRDNKDRDKDRERDGDGEPPWMRAAWMREKSQKEELAKKLAEIEAKHLSERRSEA